MNERDAEFLQRLRAAFMVEARDHLLAIGAGLLALEGADTPGERSRQLEIVYRHTHSLKGAARAASFPWMETLCQAAEDVFALCRRDRLLLSANDLDVLHRTLDLMNAHLDAGGAVPQPPSTDVAGVLSRLQAISQKGPPAAVDLPAREAGGEQPAAGLPAAHGRGVAAAAATPETVRIQTPRLDRVLLAAEELLTVKRATADLASELQRLQAGFGPWGKRWLAVQPALRRLRELAAAGDPPARAAAESAAKMLEFLEWNQGQISALEDKVRTVAQAAVRGSRLAGRQIDDLLDDTKALLMLPFSALSEMLPRLVRDLARDQGKLVDLRISGENVHLDKRMVELLRDPLVHLVRNAIDHGIEPPAQRQATGKSPRATLLVEARLLHGGQVGIEIVDDGAGLDAGRLREAALRSGAITQDAATELDEQQALELALRPDVTTSPHVTEISGRGLGLAIVREQAERLGGRLEIENRAPHGARFQIVLPQSMATLRGLFVEAGGHAFVLPSAHVERVVRAPRASLKTVSRRETLAVDGQVVALAHLHELLGLPARQAPAECLTIVLVGSGHHRLALAVDEVQRDEEILVKRLQKPLVRVRNIAGATVLASGKPVPILNVADLVKSAMHATGDEPEQPYAAPQAIQTLARRVLLAEDSITSRLLLKGILEAAGCKVTAVADGLEAFTALRSQPFDLLVSDIEMPRLDGFDLTARIRADRQLADLPVILVTALSRREDRERGIDVGANAYIAKASFDQRELLDAVRRLVGTREAS
jgi:two-component system chemotaxis sensor kinase CheA